jgi:hypothetical protein
MKKLLVTILSIVYLTVSSGATVNLHYCMGKLANWDLSASQSNQCGFCGMKKAKHKSCCKDEQKKLQIEKDQKTSESVFQFVQNSTAVVLVHHAIVPVFYFSSIAVQTPVAHAPPDTGSVPDYIRFCHFRI